jgi:hypothetical protein
MTGSSAEWADRCLMSGKKAPVDPSRGYDPRWRVVGSRQASLSCRTFSVCVINFRQFCEYRLLRYSVCGPEFTALAAAVVAVVVEAAGALA